METNEMISLESWEQQTQTLLDQLIQDREATQKRLTMLDARIEQLEMALGKKAAKPETSAKRGPRGNVTGKVLEVLTPEGVHVSAIEEQTGFNRTQVQNALVSLKKAGSVKAVARGVYAPI
jgi:predicted Rossmann fold nucleotide-binding protein DprA/Smf involved in DNA uptake